MRRNYTKISIFSLNDLKHYVLFLFILALVVGNSTLTF